MAEQNITIRLNVTQGNLAALDTLTRRIQDLRRHGAAVPVSFVPSTNTAGIDRLQAMTRQIQEQTRIPAGIEPGRNVGVLRALGYELRPGGAVAKIGYVSPATAPRVAPLPTVPEPLDVRPGGLRPWPTTLPTSPFGPAAGGPVGAPTPGPPVSPGLPVSPGPPRPPGPPVPPGPPGPPGAGDPGGGFVGTLGTMAAGGGRLLGRLAWPLRAVGGLAVGLSAVQQISQAMQAYETRHLGILQVGRQLDEQYEQVGTTLTTLQRQYQLTGREGIAAMSALGRVTGTVAAASLGTVQALRVGRAMGMAPEAAAQMQAQLTLYGPGGTPDPLALVGTYAQARARGELTRMSFPRFGEEAATIAGVGGFGAALVSPEEAGMLTRRMAGFGGRYAADPAAAFGEYYARQHAPKSEIGETLNWMAVGDVMRQYPGGVKWGTRLLNPRASFMHQQIMMSEGAHIPEYQAAQFRRAQLMAGGNRETAMQLYAQMTNAESPAEAYIEYEGLERQAAKPGGIVAQFRAAEAAKTGAAVVAGREARPYRPGQEILGRQMLPEELAQTGLIKGLEDARTAMLKTVQETALAFNTSKDSAEALGKVFDSLSTSAEKLKVLLEAIAVLVPGPLGWTAAGGAGLLELNQRLPETTGAGRLGGDFQSMYGPPYRGPWDTAPATQPRKSP